MADRIISANTFLPDFCTRESLLVVILIAEFLALVLTLVQPGDIEFLLRYFALLSLFILWIALTDVALLCWLRHCWQRLHSGCQGIIMFVLLQLVTLFYTILVGFYGAYQQPGEWGRAWLWEQSTRHFLISSMVTFFALRYFYLQHQRLLMVQAEARARIEALQARIRPHFLFNSMNIIASLTRTDPVRAERTVEDLSDLFRASIHADKRDHTLEDELDLVQSYLRIESERIGSRLAVEWVVPDKLPQLHIPPLLIQPLVENAICHGIERLIKKSGTIRIVAQYCGARHYRIEICNPVNIEAQQHVGNRVAYKNITQRLELAFGDQASLTTVADQREHRVTLRLPLGVGQ